MEKELLYGAFYYPEHWDRKDWQAQCEDCVEDGGAFPGVLWTLAGEKVRTIEALNKAWGDSLLESAISFF